MILKQVIKIKNNIREIQLFLVLLFLLNPFIGIITFFNVFYDKNKLEKKKLINLFIILLALFLAFVNSTKIPDNDLYSHGGQYLMAENFSIFQYVIHMGKEPFYYFFNYLFFHISGGSFTLWVITFTFISYLFFFKSIKLFFLKINAPTSSLVFALVIAAFFPQLFSLSAHLIRQFIASSLVMYFAVNLIFYGKNKWIIALLAILTHASSALLIMLLYFKPIRSFNKNIILNTLLILSLVFYQKIAKLLLFFFESHQNGFTYLLRRASDDTTYDLGSFPTVNFIMMFLIIIIAVTSKPLIKRMNTSNFVNLEGNKNIEKQIIFFFNVMIFFSFFILNNLKQSELSIRLFFYLFFYFPIMFPLFILKFKERVLISYLLSLLFMLFFIYRLAFGRWQYDSLYKLLINPSFFYLFKEPLNIPNI